VCGGMCLGMGRGCNDGVVVEGDAMYVCIYAYLVGSKSRVIVYFQ
jgi:hypothetical protein